MPVRNSISAAFTNLTRVTQAILASSASDSPQMLLKLEGCRTRDSSYIPICDAFLRQLADGLRGWHTKQLQLELAYGGVGELRFYAAFVAKVAENSAGCTIQRLHLP